MASLDRRLDDQQATLVLTTEPVGAEVFVDGGATAAGRTPLTVRLAPGEHALRVALDDHETALRTIDLAAGQRSAITLRLEPAEAAAPPAPPPPGPRATRTPDEDAAWMPWAVVGVGGAVTVTGAVLLAQAVGAADDRDALLREGGSVDEAQGLDDDARLYQTLGWAGVGVGLAAVGAGLAWWLLDDEDATISLGPWGPAGAAAQVRF